MPPSHEAVAAQLALIEAELHRAGLWQEAPLPDEAFDFSRAFGADTMSYAQWLQFVFVPRVRELVEARGEFPASSSVGAQAVREFDGFAEADALVQLLSDFDALFDA
ncbi:MAG TPA: YqcC family protein [Myxococcales bacterium]|nr:YqcC family protein [Myxococcales bacterium]